MEIIISVLLGIWVAIAGFLCFFNYKKDFKDLLHKNKDTKEE